MVSKAVLTVKMVLAYQRLKHMGHREVFDVLSVAVDVLLCLGNKGIIVMLAESAKPSNKLNLS